MQTRRELLRLALAGCGTTLLAACSGSEPSESEEEPQTVEAPPTNVVVSDAVEERPASEFARMLQAGEVQSVRVIGDSITAGFGCDGFGPTTDTLIYEGYYGAFWESAPEVQCWANDFRAYCAMRGVSSFVNAGICGAKMRWLAEDPEVWIREGADVIFVMLGTNDAVYDTAEEYRANAEAALAAVAAACSHMVVLGPPDNAWTDYTKATEQDAICQVLQELCQAHGWPFVSLLDVIVPWTDLVNDDQCHPTSKGSHALWERLVQELGL